MTEANSESQKLADRCAAYKSDIASDNESWKQFVHDHRRYILSKCTKTVLDVNTMLKYKYRPYTFATEVLNIQKDATWIVLYINNIDNIMEFNESLDTLMTFGSDVITELFRLYESANQ